MNQSTSKTVNAANVCRCLAALLATLALLASMTLPVYAEALENAAAADDTQTTASEVVADDSAMSEDNTTPDTTGAGETADDAANTTEDDNSGDTDETPADDVTTPDAPAEDDTQSDADDVDDKDASDTAGTIIPAGSTDTTPDQDSEEAENDFLADVPATQANEDTFSLYFAVPTAWGDVTAVSVYALKGNSSGDGDITKQMTPGFKTTADGRKIYGVTYTYSSNDTLKECPYGGFAKIEFSSGSNKVSANLEPDKKDSSKYWQYVADLRDRYYDDETKTWKSITDLTNPHTFFAGKPIWFENKSNSTVSSVRAIFYGVDGTTVVDDNQTQSNVEAGKSVSFKIPAGSCAYVKFVVDEKDTATYNFYGEGDSNKFLYSNTQNCLIYTAENNVTWGVRGSIRVYFDATLSKLSYANEDKSYQIPKDDNSSVYYYLTGTNGESYGWMTKNSSDTSGNTYYVEVPAGYDHIIFGAYEIKGSKNLAWSGDSTANLEIPTTLDKPCFYADTSDDVVYNSDQTNQRGGYWDELGQVRDAAKGKGTTVVDVESAAFEKKSDTKYISSTLYDYYSDWELNGNNRDKYNTDYAKDGKDGFVCYRNWVVFRQFDQAISDYYSQSGTTVEYPMYTGHFQPDAADEKSDPWGYRFSAIADTLGLYGYANSKNVFMAVNNSTIDKNGGGLGKSEGKHYAETFQGLAGPQLQNGEPVMYNTDLVMPFFNKDFLLGSNSKKTKLGEVYEDVSFPFTQKEVFGESNVKYWYFDSNKTTLYLKNDTSGDEGYFLQPQTNQDIRSSNLLSSSAYAKNGNDLVYGFFPFNSGSTQEKASTYNYGFGAKLQFQFTLTSDGMVLDKSGKAVPIKFFFSGDDDVWVYIDGKLALDVGGAHGKASGLLEFGADNEGNNTYTSYVSDIKTSNNNAYNSGANKSVTYLGKPVTFKYASKNSTTLSSGVHTLTMYYMERGMWESNMAIAFNFPDNNELEVEKQVKVDGVNELFKKYFQNADLFGFTIKNLATHYGEQKASELLDTKELKVDKASWMAKPANKNQCGWEQTELGNISSTDAIHWYAGMTDANSDYRPQRYGVITPNSGTADISEMGYLTFKVYAKTTSADYLKLNDLYLELEDSGGHKWGSLNKAGLAGKTYNGISTLTMNDWVTVKIDLSKLTKHEGFDARQLKTIYIGDNRPVNLYIKDIQFTSKAEVKVLAGFRTAQKDIPDYETAIGNTEQVMKPAKGAQYTSNRGGSTQVVDEEGRFQLRDKEVITFKDQFRRGSYISVTEDANPDLYDTKWTIYENGQAVTTNNGGDTVSKGTLPLQDVTGYTPDDGRTEGTSVAIGLEDDNSNNSYTGKKPGEAIVFRSYSNPDANDTAELTKLRLQFVNTVKTGSITIKKAGDDTVTSGTFQFKVTYTNVGGQNLEGEDTIEVTYNVEYGVPYVISGIPIGTQFTIEEIESNDTYLQKVEVAEGDSAQVIKGKTVEGTVTKKDSASVTATFTNTKHQLMDIDLIKNWQNASGQPMTDDELETVPSTIYVKLQRRIIANPANPWTDVPYPSGSTLGYVEIKRDNGGWHYKFANLDATQWDSTEETKPQYEYRVVEGTVENDKFTPMAEGKTTIVLDGKAYEVSGGTETTTEDGKHTITLTNKLQNPEFNLDVIKKSAEEPQTPLDGVEFTLERMTEDGTAVDTSFEKRTGVTNSNGEIKAKNADETASDADIFHGLKAGIYRLTETKTKAGYSLLSGPITIRFTQKGECLLNGTAAGENIFKPNTDGSYTLTLTVLNRKVPELPHTGADAPSLWLLIGLPLAVAGLLVLVFRYNKKGGRTK